MIPIRKFLFAGLTLGIFCIAPTYKTLNEMNGNGKETRVNHHYRDNNNNLGNGGVGNSKLCKRTDIRQGSWVERVNATGAIGGGSELAQPDRYRWVPHGANSNDSDSDADAGKNGNSNNSSCLYQEDFNSTLFCNLMKNAVIMFIGDSIIWEMYQSLVHLTGARASKRVHIRSVFNRGLPVFVNVCGNQNVTLLYRWSKQLDGAGTSIPIDQMLREHFPLMVVLNTGAHYQSDSAFRAKLGHALDLMSGWQQLCQERNLTSCPFFWRTSSPGIPNCKNFTRPAGSLVEMEQHVAANPIYNWEKFHIQNDIAVRMLEEASVLKGLTYEIIDGYEIGIQRPEFHISANDCLHNTHLASADAENTALLHYLAASRMEEDISRAASYSYEFPRVTNVKPDGKDIDWILVNGLQ